MPIVAVVSGLDWYLFVLFQKQTKEIKEKQTSVMAELAKVEPAVQDAKMGKFPEHSAVPVQNYQSTVVTNIPLTLILETLRAGSGRYQMNIPLNSVHLDGYT